MCKEQKNRGALLNASLLNYAVKLINVNRCAVIGVFVDVFYLFIRGVYTAVRAVAFIDIAAEG